MSELRTIYLSGGATIAGYLYLHGYDRLKKDLTADTWKWNFTPGSTSASVSPIVWKSPASGDVRDLTVPTGEIRVGILIGVGGYLLADIPLGDYHAWLLPGDSPEAEPTYCGRFRIA